MTLSTLLPQQELLLMMHEWLLGSNATVASERINLAWDEDTVGKSTVRWRKVLKISRVQIVQKNLIVKKRFLSELEQRGDLARWLALSPDKDH
ncbi:hypothetical protein KIN20_034748 [Parelaphostrongylus tenuis]|uniref:Uncharacterized protein n=1 Tax=Parelaphostrongylus tenuis TaxID=148309 RepID=A0AAD5RAH6_PARTN|nr:hypothetical protein KIN20_034748 [Parelaphostrongylus tenuis]